MATISRETEKLQIINNVFTPPKHRGKGYATEICSVVASRIRKKGNYPILTVNTENKHAINIYEKIGFQKKGKVGLFLH
jgi:predicted GNAT family acetyltransferase